MKRAGEDGPNRQPCFDVRLPRRAVRYPVCAGDPEQATNPSSELHRCVDRTRSEPLHIQERISAIILRDIDALRSRPSPRAVPTSRLTTRLHRHLPGRRRNPCSPGRLSDTLESESRAPMQERYDGYPRPPRVAFGVHPAMRLRPLVSLRSSGASPALSPFSPADVYDEAASMISHPRWTPRDFNRAARRDAWIIWLEQHRQERLQPGDRSSGSSSTGKERVR